MVVRVSLKTMKDALLAKRKSLVKLRRNELAAAAKSRKLSVEGKAPSGQAEMWSKRADDTLSHIRRIDARVGLLNEAQNERSWAFEVDLRDPALRELGFGLDDSGNYPAL